MKKKILISSLAWAPMFALASGADVGDIVGVITGIFSSVVPLMLTLATVYFVWALIQYISKAGEEKETAKTQMIWGIVILFVIVSVWGLVNILTDTANLDNSIPNVDWVADEY